LSPNRPRECHLCAVIRQQRGRPLADAFQKWLRTELGLISQKGKLADAIRYALSRWEGLTRSLDDGRIELDNSPPRTLHPFDHPQPEKCALRRLRRRRRALHRHRFADRTCKLNDVDPLALMATTWSFGKAHAR
jgi:transposase